MPARADDGDTYTISGVAIEASANSAKVSAPVAAGTTVTFSIDANKIEVKKNGNVITEGFALDYQWDDGLSVAGDKLSASIAADAPAPPPPMIRTSVS